MDGPIKTEIKNNKNATTTKFLVKMWRRNASIEKANKYTDT